MTTPKRTPGRPRKIGSGIVEEVFKATGWTVEQLARELVTTRRTLQNWQSGSVIPKIKERRLQEILQEYKK